MALAPGPSAVKEPLMTTLRPLTSTATASRRRLLDLGGQAVHLFRFGAPAALAYEYFLDIPAVFQLLPDVLDVRTYAANRYRLTVGASAGHGHSMAAIFDLQAELDPGRSIKVFPADDGPPVQGRGMAFTGALAAEAIFLPDGARSAVEYAVDIEMSILIPGVLGLMPMQFLQNLGERAMEFKMTQMINGFTRAINADFNAWMAGEA